MKNILCYFKNITCALCFCISCTAAAQDTVNRNELGLTLFTVTPDMESVAAFHVLWGLQYKYHFDQLTLRSSFRYFSNAELEYYPHEYTLEKTKILTVGIEKYFLKGRFRLTQGVDFLLRSELSLHTLRYERDIYNRVTYGPAISAGMVYNFNDHLSIGAETELELMISGNDMELFYPVISLVSINYRF